MVLPHSSRAEKVVWLVLQNAFVLGRLVQKLGHCFKKNSSPWIKWIFFKVKMPGKQHTGNTAGHKKERKGSMIIGSLRRWNSESERCHPLKTNKCQEAGREKKTHRWFSSQSTPVGNRGGWNTEKKNQEVTKIESYKGEVQDWMRFLTTSSSNVTCVLSPLVQVLTLPQVPTLNVF